MSLFQMAVTQPQKMLKNLSAWLDKSIAYAETKSFDPEVLLELRLAPDQHPLLRQFQMASDTAKFLAARLSGKEAPSHPDDETNLEEIKARLNSVIEYLDTFKASDFEGAAERIIPLPFLPGQGATGADYITEFAIPNFFFHVTTAYSIMRHNGVELGKRDYIGSVNLKEL